VRLEAALSGNLEATLRADAERIAKARRNAIGKTTRSVQLAARDAVNRRFAGSGKVSGGGRRIGNAIRSKVYDDGSFKGAGLVFSKFGRGRGAGFVDYLLPYVEGATLQPTRGGWLYVPIEKRGKRGPRARGYRVTAEDKGVRLVKSSDGKRIYIVRQTRTRSILVAVLVKRIRIARSLSFDAVVRSADQEFYRRFIDELETLERA